METNFGTYRNERRSFFCPNRLWEELQKQAGEDISVSNFIRKAILEKMIREEPEKKEYFEELFL